MDVKYSDCAKPNICRNCQGEFPNWATINGKRVSLGARTYCLTCSPYKEGRGRGNKTRLESYRDGKKRCIDCERYLGSGSFYSYKNSRGTQQSSSRCKRCTYEQYVSVKRDAVAYMGGKCVDCSGVFHYSVFDFHHLDPAQKEKTIMANHPTTLDSVKDELTKCVLLCSNCHRDRHNNPENSNYLPIGEH